MTQPTTTHEAVLGGARWRLTLHPDGRWDVARKVGAIWDDMFSGDRGTPGLLDAIDDLRAIKEGARGLLTTWAGAGVLQALADVAERNTT